MVRKRKLSESKKKLIASLYHETDASIGTIADTLDVHRHTVNKYKDYKIT